ncbi:MAG: agmatinase [Gemmatimonadota bacterium]
MVSLSDSSGSNGVAGPVTIIGFPYDASSSYQRGAAEAPAAIRRALYCDSSNLWTESLRDVGAMLVQDGGDLECGDPAATRAAIEAAISAIVAAGRRPLSLGGDHSITYPIMRAVGRRWPGLTLLHFDAHPDLYDELDGDRFSHACPFARILEEGLVSRLVQIGIRTMNAKQMTQVERHGVEVIPMRDWRDELVLSIEGPVYVSLDLDVLDPAFAPGISHPEPGGASVRQLLNAVQHLEAPIVGADLVEYNPRNDLRNLTGMVCAKLVKELLDRMMRETGGNC